MYILTNANENLTMKLRICTDANAQGRLCLEHPKTTLSQLWHVKTWGSLCPFSFLFLFFQRFFTYVFNVFSLLKTRFLLLQFQWFSGYSNRPPPWTVILQVTSEEKTSVAMSWVLFKDALLLLLLLLIDVMSQVFLLY